MRYFLVFQNKTYKEEMSAGYLWAPKRNRDGRTFFHWENMTKIKKGDIIFSSVKRKIVSVNTAQTDCFDAPRPIAFDKLEMWERNGWMVRTQYDVLEHPIDIDKNINKILTMLPDKYAPFNSVGRGSQGYLFEIGPDLSDFFLHSGKRAFPIIDNRLKSSGQGDGSMARGMNDETNSYVSYLDGFSSWLATSQKYTEKMLQYHIDLINITSEYLIQELKYLKPIENINTIKELDTVIGKLKSNSNFRINNILNNNGQIKALELYRKYLLAIQSGKTGPPSKSTGIQQAKNDIATIFRDEKYSSFVSALLSQGITTISQLKNISIYAFLNDNNISYGDKRYDLLKEITITAGLKPAKTDEIQESGTINDAAIIDKKSTPVASDENRYSGLLKEVEAYLEAKENQAVTVENIRNDLNLGKRSVIGRLIKEVPWAVEMEPNTYIHRNSILDIDDAAEKMLTALQRLFAKNSGYASMKQLFDAVRSDLEFFMFDNDLKTPEQLYTLAMHLFSKEQYKGSSFIFYNRMHIWEKDPDYPKNYAGLIVKWAREQNNVIGKDICLGELERIGAANPSTAFYMAIRENRDLFWQYAPFQYVIREAVPVNDDWQDIVKKSLDQLLSNVPFVVPRSIAEYFFNSLPTLTHNVLWTPLLLQDVIRDLDLGFRTIPAGEGQDSDVVHAAIVHHDSNFKTFADIAWYLINEEIGTPQKMMAEEMRQILVDKQVLKGNERIWGMHKAIPNDYRFVWLDDNNKVLIGRA